MLPIKLIAFDLDGTLVDSAPDLALAINAMLVDLGREPQTEKTIRHWIGNGAPILVHRALTQEKNGRADTALFEQAHSLFIKHYHVCLNEKSQLYPEVRTTLQTLQQAGFLLACITNKPAQFTEPFLDELGIASFFSYIASGDSFEFKKPHPMPLLETAKFFKVAAAESVMVGDSINDIQAAKKADFYSVCVDYGYSAEHDVHHLGANKVISKLSELLKIVQKVA